MKRIPKKIILLILSIAILATGTVVFFACQPKDNSTPPPANTYTVTLTPPSDGSTPETHSGLDNLAFMAGRLAARSYYHTETVGLVDTVAKQKIAGSKDYYNSLLITESVSTSTFANVAQQKFYGDNKVVVRGPKYGKSKWDGINTVWSDDKPVEVLDKEHYIEKYGLWASEFSDYVLNEETILEVSDLTVTEDGYYQQTFTLDHDTATYYQKCNMRTMGGLDSYPVYSLAEITFTFDETWAVIKADIVEKYNVTFGVLKPACKSTTTITYSYEESTVDVSAFESYFKNYADADVTDESEKELGVLDYLQKGLLEELTPDSVFDLTATVDGNEVKGKLSLDISSGLNAKVALGDLVLNVNLSDLYIQYKDFCGKLALSDLTDMLGGELSFDTDALLEEIVDGEIVKDNGNVEITCNLTLGEMQIPLTFNFTENDETVTFVNASTSLEISGMALDVNLSKSETDTPIVDINTENAVDVNSYVTSILGLVENKSFTVSADYSDAEKGLSVSGEVYINANTPAIGGAITVGYETLEIPVSFTYVDNVVYLSVFDVNVKATTDYLKTALVNVLDVVGVALPETAAIEISEIISVALNIDYDTVIKTLSLTDSNLSLTVNVDTIFDGLTLGDISADYDVTENAFTLSVYGVTAKLQGVEVREVIAPENAVDIQIYVESITEFINDKNYDLTIEYTNEELGLEIRGSVYIDAVTPAVSGALTVNYETLSAPLTFSYVNETVYLSVYDINVKATLEYLGTAVEKVLEYAGITLPETTEINVDKVLEYVLKLDYETNVKTLTLTDEELIFVLNVDNIITDFALGDVVGKYSVTNTEVNLSAYGVTATLKPAEQQAVVAPENSEDFIDAVLLEKFAQPILSLINTNDIAFAFDFATNILDIDMSVSLIGEVKFAETLTELYIKAQIAVDGYADEVVEIVFADGVLSLVYEGYAMQVGETQITDLAQSLSSLFATGGEKATDGFNAATLLFSEDGIDLNALIESLKLLGKEENGSAILSLAVNLGLISADLSTVKADIVTDGSILSFNLTENTQIFGLTVNKLYASVNAAENEYAYDISSAIVCKNAFEFVLQAYVALADTNYLNVAIVYDSELITANVNGLFEFVSADDNGAAMNINFDISAEVHTFVYDESGQKVSNGSHYLDMVTVGDTAYITYSLFGYNADTALNVKITIEELFEIGEVAMPLLMPILGIPEDAFYLDMVTNLLSMTYTKFSTEICNAIQFADLLKLIEGLSVQNSEVQTAQAESVNISEMLDIFAISKNDNGETVISINGIEVAENESLSLALTAQKSGTIAVDTSKAYIDISTIADLLKDVLGAYEYADTGYEISGTVKLAIIGIELDLNLKVNLKVAMDDDGNIFLNANITVDEYSNYLVWGLFGNKCIIDGNATTDITFKDGNIYMTRVRTSKWNGKDFAGIGGKFETITPEYIYRKMPVSEFGTDIMNQLFWAINLSSGAKDYIGKQIENSESSSTAASSYDAGDMVKAYALSNNVYNLKLNLAAVANNSSLGDLNINITRSQSSGRDYYDLTNLHGTITLVSVITATFDLNHTSLGSPVDFSIVDTNISRVNANV